MPGLWVLLILTSLVALGGIVESMGHRRNVSRIPIRIHVNGTRGKSSVTRLIAAGLREAGIVTCAKTTGTLPRMILPDGSEYPVFRPARANVIEQVRIISTATAYDAQALVIECMALLPYLQSLSELKLVRATHTVITNARADHLDVMGPGEQDVALALAGTVPVKGKLFTAEQRHLDVFRAAAADRGSKLIAVGPEEIAAVTPKEMARFRYVEHAENVALALRVCIDLGVERETALKGMWKAQPDAGAMTNHEIHFFGNRRIFFVNGFAANDPESTERIWGLALARYANVEKRIAIFNCRLDRPDRSQQLGTACTSWPRADYYLLIGSGTHIFARAALRQGLEFGRIIMAEHLPVGEVFEKVVALGSRSALVMGMGNIGGPGLDLVQYFRNRSLIEDVA
jgi:poly-gamma-glutamate synthase PgsB/CapB